MVTDSAQGLGWTRPRVESHLFLLDELLLEPLRFARTSTEKIMDELLKILQANATESRENIARMLNLPVAEVNQRIAEYDHQGQNDEQAQKAQGHGDQRQAQPQRLGEDAGGRMRAERRFRRG